MVRLSRFQTVLALGIALVALGMVQVPEAGAQNPATWLPLALTGYNADVIYDKDPTVAWSVGYDGSGTPASGGCAWYESGVTDASGTTWNNGVPAGQTFESATGMGPVYLIQPAALPNILQVSAGNTATLTLVTPAPYSSIAVISSSGSASANSVGTATIMYMDGSSDTAGFNTFDWCSNNNPASALAPQGGAPKTDRNCPNNFGGNKGSTTFAHSTCSGGSASLYETIIPIDNTKTLVSVSFTAPSPAECGVWGISAMQ